MHVEKPEMGQMMPKGTRCHAARSVSDSGEGNDTQRPQLLAWAAGEMSVLTHEERPRGNFKMQISG